MSTFLSVSLSICPFVSLSVCLKSLSTKSFSQKLLFQVIRQTGALGESTSKVFPAKPCQRKSDRLTVDVSTETDGAKELRRLGAGQARQEEGQGEERGRGLKPGRVETRLRLPALPEVLRLELQP